MALSGPPPDGAASTAAARPPAEVVWHDLECGAYGADLPFWRELAELAAPRRGSQPILDVGAGTGRVTLDLARRGHRMSALDINPVLLAALAARAEGVGVATECADARTFELDERGFALVLMPMQTLQLLDGAAARGAFFARARAHMQPGALLACAIVTDLEPFDCQAGDLGPSAETAIVAGCRYLSRATRVRVRGHAVAIERERRIVDASGSATHAPDDVRGEPATAERNVVELARVSVSRVQREAARAGLASAGTREIPATQEHVGSAVVMLSA
jgi:SAM-dependent methyltransferase